jgi:hypothetical protein
MVISKEVLTELKAILSSDAFFWQEGPAKLYMKGIVARESGIFYRNDGFYLVYTLLGYGNPVRVEKITASRALPGKRVVFLTLEDGVSDITIMTVGSLILKKTRDHYLKMAASVARDRLRIPVDTYSKTIEWIAEGEGLTRVEL